MLSFSFGFPGWGPQIYESFVLVTTPLAHVSSAPRAGFPEQQHVRAEKPRITILITITRAIVYALKLGTDITIINICTTSSTSIIAVTVTVISSCGSTSTATPSSITVISPSSPRWGR